MRHTFHFGQSFPHRANLLTRQDVCIVGYSDGFATLAQKLWRGLMRSIAKAKQKRLKRELALHGVKYSVSDKPRVPVFLHDEWEY